MEPVKPHGLAGLLAQSDAIGLTVFALLACMSVICWYLIVLKSWRNLQARRSTRLFMDAYRRVATPADLGVLLQDGVAANAPARLASRGLDTCRHLQSDTRDTEDRRTHEELLLRSLRDALAREGAVLESGLTVLGSIASTAPFVGLFGTVWGIYHALVGIGAAGTATLDAVAGPVGEALIMTATGLAVAIPAVLSFNAFARRNRLQLVELDGFAHDLLVFLSSDRKLPARGASAGRPETLHLAPGKGAA